MLRIQKLGLFLEAHFGDVEYHMPDEDADEDAAEHADAEGADAPLPRSSEPSFLIQLDEIDARINLLSMVRAFILRIDVLPYIY